MRRKNTNMPFLLVMVPFFSEKIHLVRTLSSGYVNFIQKYDVMDGCLLSSDISSMNLKTGFPGVESLKTFLQNLGEALVLSLNKVWEKTIWDHPTPNQCRRFLHSMNRSYHLKVISLG